MILKSTAIVRGRVSAPRPAQHGAIVYTHWTVQVSDRWKGNAAASVDVVVPGGALGRVTQTFAGSPKLTEGSEYVLFLWTGRTGLTHVVGLAQGILDLKKDSSGEPVVVRAAITDTILDPNTGQPVGDQPIRLRLREFTARVSSVLEKGQQ